MTYHFTKQQLREIKRRYEAGESQPSIAKSFGCSNKVIHRRLIDLGVEIASTTKIELSKGEVAEIEKRYKRGETAADIARVMKYSKSFILKKLEKMDMVVVRSNKMQFNKRELSAIKRRYENGENLNVIAKDFGCSRSVIKRLLVEMNVSIIERASEKLCIVCGTLLNRSNTTWYRQKNYIHKCNDCIRAEKRVDAVQRSRRDPALASTRTRKYKAKLRTERPKRYTADQMRSSARKRAKALGIGFDLEVGYIESICPDQCPVLGITLKYGGGEKEKASASLDRIVPSRGYTKGNVMVISLLANTMKNEANPEELKNFARWVLSNYE